MSFCQECGGEDFVTECGEDGEVLSLVCSLCGTELSNDPNKENESMDDEDEEEEEYHGDIENFVDIQETEAVKKSKDNSKVKSKKSKTSKQDRPRVEKPVETVIDMEPEARPDQKCKSCGGTNLISDVMNDVEQLICQDCGFFNEEQMLVASRDFASNDATGKVYGWSRATLPRHGTIDPQENKRNVYGTQTIQQMSSLLNWESYLTEQAMELYKQIYPHRKVKFTSNMFKDALCVACMYSVARENKVKLTLKTLLSLKDVKKKLLTKALNTLKSVQEKPLAHHTVSSLSEHVLSGCGFDKTFMDKVSKLVNVCEKGFLTQGRDHDHVVTCVAYLVWVSQDYIHRKNASMPRFCEQHRLKFTRHFSLLQKHVRQLFVTLARRLPWLTASSGAAVNTKNCVWYLDGICDYGYSLVSIASQGNSVSASTSATDDTSSVGSSVNSSRCSSVDGEPPLAKLPVLAPPSMRLARSPRRPQSPPPLPAHLTAEDLDREDLSDTEFPNQEISSYILSTREVEIKRFIQKEMDAASESD